ncbi:MAG: NAD(+)/NADH kinase [Bacillota bacterium]
MKKVGLVVNLEKENIRNLVKETIGWLQASHCRPLLAPAAARALEFPEYTAEEISKEAECLIVLGGDGTLLNSARQAAPAGIPILGINIGRMGFLTEVDAPDLFFALERLLKGEYAIEGRMMLEARVYRRGKWIERSSALNDAVVTKGAFARLIFLETYVNNEYVATYPADGLIIASPTGSTAYSLSAGGPLVSPELELMLVTPICPHSLWARPLVIGADEEIKINVNSQNEEVMLTMDGQYGFRLEQNDTVVVTKSPFRAKFIRLKNRSFYYLLRKKLSEGEKVGNCDEGSAAKEDS